MPGIVAGGAIAGAGAMADDAEEEAGAAGGDAADDEDTADAGAGPSALTGAVTVTGGGIAISPARLLLANCSCCHLVHTISWPTK